MLLLLRRLAVATSSTPGATTSASNDLPPAAAVAAQQGTSTTGTAPGVAQASTGHGELITITTDTLKLVIDTKGGNIHKASLPKYLEEVDKPDVPVKIFSDSPEDFYIAQSGLMGPTGPDTAKGQVIYHADKTAYVMPFDQNTLSVDLKWHDSHGLSVTKRFILTRGHYDLNVEYIVDNQGTEDWRGSLYAQIQRVKGSDGGLFGLHTYTGAAISSEQTPYEKITYKEMKKNNLSRAITGGWVAMQRISILSVLGFRIAKPAITFLVGCMMMIFTPSVLLRLS